MVALGRARTSTKGRCSVGMGASLDTFLFAGGVTT